MISGLERPTCGERLKAPLHLVQNRPKKDTKITFKYVDDYQKDNSLSLLYLKTEQITTDLTCRKEGLNQFKTKYFLNCRDG